MRIIKYWLISFLLLLINASENKAFAADPVCADTTIDVLIELDKLESALYDTLYRNFGIIYYRERTDSITVRDTSSKSIAIQLNKFVFGSGSEGVMQEFGLRLSISSNMLQVMIEPPAGIWEYIIPENPTDPDFYHQYVYSVTTTDSGAYRKISFQFLPGSPLEQYEIMYEIATYNIYTIKYRLVEFSYEDLEPVLKSRESVTMVFNGYTSSPGSELRTAIDFILSNVNGTWQLAPPYFNFELINLLNQ
jgi:hypothetical protein